MPVRILLVDDHVLVRQGLKGLLEREGFAVVGEASDGQEGLQQAKTVRPDIVVMDISMPTINGLSAACEIQKKFPKTKTVLLTQHDEKQYVTEALEAGVKGYVLKNQAGSDLLQALRQVSRGQVYLSPGVAQAVVESYQSNGGKSGTHLTVRERQVLQLIAEGKSTKDIAAVLGISVKTAESHRTRLVQKLDIHETASLVRYAVRNGIVEA
jgi:two-component system, NarL family, response regulator NreC